MNRSAFLPTLAIIAAFSLNASAIDSTKVLQNGSTAASTAVAGSANAARKVFIDAGNSIHISVGQGCTVAAAPLWILEKTAEGTVKQIENSGWDATAGSPEDRPALSKGFIKPAVPEEEGTTDPSPAEMLQ